MHNSITHVQDVQSNIAHTLTWSPTVTTRCFSTWGLPRQNQQGPLGAGGRGWGGGAPGGVGKRAGRLASGMPLSVDSIQCNIINTDVSLQYICAVFSVFHQLQHMYVHVVYIMLSLSHLLFSTSPSLLHLSLSLSPLPSLAPSTFFPYLLSSLSLSIDLSFSFSLSPSLVLPPFLPPSTLHTLPLSLLPPPHHLFLLPLLPLCSVKSLLVIEELLGSTLVLLLNLMDN